MKIVPTGVSRSIAKSIFTAKRNSPHIFFASGIVGVITSTVLACKATLKLEKTIDEIKKDVDSVKELTISPKLGMEEYTDKDKMKDMSYVCVKGVIKLGQLYGPSVALGTISIVALTGSHVQLTRRNTALSATLTAVTNAFDKYRERVRNEIGEDRELEIYRNMENVVVEDDTGKKKKIKAVNPNGMSPYARCFDEANVNWVKNSEINRFFLTAQQNYFNHRLTAYGYVFLNDVYESLGFERTDAGQIVGWIINGEGDGYVDFGFFEAYNTNFVNDIEPRIWLDFNVDGNIIGKTLEKQ